MVDVRFSRPAMWLTAVTFTLAACGVGAPAPPVQVPVPRTAAEAPTGFDNRSNGTVNDSTHQADQDAFDEVEEIADGLGPLYNAQACRECHQNPTSGAASQITELRVGHLGPDGRFQNADIPIARGTVTISGRTLVNDRAICPNAEFPDSEIQERVPDTETIRTTRASLNLLGDGFVEAVAQQVEGGARRADRLRVGHPLLNLGIRERGVGANGPIVDERATGDDDRPARDRDVGVAEPSIRSQMAHPQFRDLTRSTRGGVLMALAAGLRVVQGSQAIRDFFHFVECVLIGLVDGVIARAVAPVVESGGCLRRGARNRDLNRW